MDSVTEASVYGLASKPLSMALDSVTDLLEAYLSPSSHPSPLPGSPPDTAVEPDLLFVRQFTGLALRVMAAQCHWEGLVGAGLRLCEGVRRGGGGGEWEGWMGSEVLPLVLRAQRELAQRVEEHSRDIKREGERECVRKRESVCMERERECVCERERVIVRE